MLHLQEASVEIRSRPRNRGTVIHHQFFGNIKLKYHVLIYTQSVQRHIFYGKLLFQASYVTQR